MKSLNLIKRRNIPLAWIIVFTLSLSLSVYSQEESKPYVMASTDFEIKPGHSAQFLAGVKAWKKCYKDNGGDGEWNVWRRVNGAGNAYTVTSTMENWAEMDDDNDEAGNKCAATAINLIVPNVKSQSNHYSRFMPEISQDFPEDTKVVWVGYYRVKNSDLHNSIIKDVVSAIKAKEGKPRGVWYSSAGGDTSAPDYFVAVPMKKFADMDMKRDGVWKIYEDANGKKKADEMREQFRNNLESSWSYMFALNEELSN